MEDEPIIVVTGTPGVGKTTVSNCLATKLNAVHLNLAAMARRDRLYTGKDPLRKTFIVDIERLTKNIENRIKNIDSRVIVSGHYAMNVISSRHNVKVFVLRCDPYELEERLKRKGFDPKKIAENVQAEILDICFFDAVGVYGEDRVYQVDVSKKSISETCSKIIGLLENRIIPEKKVDWLGKLEASGALEKFFVIER